jgi:hypothetical protein
VLLTNEQVINAGVVRIHGKGDIRTYFFNAPTLRSLSNTGGHQAGSGATKIREYYSEKEYKDRPMLPIECEGMMGWQLNSTAKGLTEDGKETDISSTQRHKMLGNGIVPQEITEILLSLKPILETLTWQDG